MIGEGSWEQKFHVSSSNLSPTVVTVTSDCLLIVLTKLPPSSSYSDHSLMFQCPLLVSDVEALLYGCSAAVDINVQHDIVP